MTKYRLQDSPIPEGFQIYEDQVEVAGIQYRKEDAAKFVRGREHWLELDPEPSNQYHPDAIRVVGHCKRYFWQCRYFIGYLPKEIADRIAETRFRDEVRPRLLKTYEGPDGVVEVLLQVLGPKGRKHEYSGTPKRTRRKATVTPGTAA